MKGILIAFFSIVLLVFGFVILRGLYEGAQYALSASVASARSEHISVGGSGPQAHGPYTIHGTVLMDTSHGIPAVPYVEYVGASGATTTKQLVYMDARACAPSAGDYPCTPSYTATTGYPQLAAGEHIIITGYIYENRFLITSLSDG